ncbi:ParA family protein [Streptomyces sp. NPDC006283]|uniref:ParA family protein n=1 Tax=Streptomyces sp. NPDC006283 TaxID=3156741 RepID=UPI0033A4132E
MIANMNRAGSVGKTTHMVTMWTLAALRGYRGLIVDADLQSDASYWFGWDGDNVPDGVATVHDVMLGRAKLRDAIVPARTRIGPGSGPDAFMEIPGLFILRGHKKMAQADGELIQDGKGVFWLQIALKRGVGEEEFDFIGVDCPASLGRLSVSLLVASTEVAVCMKPTRKEIRGALALKDEIAKVRAGYEDWDATPDASLFIMNEAKEHDSQGKFYKGIQEEAEKLFGDRLMPMVKGSVLVPEAYDAQEPLPYWAPQAPILNTYRKVLDRTGFTEQAA